MMLLESFSFIVFRNHDVRYFIVLNFLKFESALINLGAKIVQLILFIPMQCTYLKYEETI